MGWLVYNHTPACIRDEITRLCKWDNEAGRGFPVLISRKGSVWYAAVRSEPATGRQVSGTDASGSFQIDANGGYTFATVFLTRRENGGWGYKDMDETAGPVECEAPGKASGPAVTHHPRIRAGLAAALPQPRGPNWPPSEARGRDPLSRAVEVQRWQRGADLPGQQGTLRRGEPRQHLLYLHRNRPRLPHQPCHVARLDPHLNHARRA